MGATLLVELYLPRFTMKLFAAVLGGCLVCFCRPSGRSKVPGLVPRNEVILKILAMVNLVGTMKRVVSTIASPLVTTNSSGDGGGGNEHVPLVRGTTIPFKLYTFLVFFIPLGCMDNFGTI